MFSLTPLSLRSSLGFLLCLSTFLTCLAWPNASPTRAAREASGAGAVPEAANSIDGVEFFVRQNYLDFLNREPDAPGLAFWVNNITSCGGEQACVERKRIDTSAAFFLSVEFQQTGYLVYRTYGAAFGRTRVGGAVPLRLNEFLPDTRRVGQGVVVNAPGWEQALEANKQAFFNEFVARPQFLAAYPGSMTPAAFVSALNQNTGGALSPGESSALAADLSANAKTRAQVLRAVAEDTDFDAREKNRAFVLMQYFGYLRRNPNDAPELNLDFAGYNFWLAKLNQFNGNHVSAEMVKAFLVSGEYRARFISGEQVLSSVSRDLSSGFGQLQLPGVMEIELSDNRARPPMPFTLSYVSSPQAVGFFRDEVRAQGLPPVAAGGLLKISAPQTFPGFLGLRVSVRDEVLAELAPGLSPQLYVFVPDRTDLEDSGEYVPLDSTYDPGTGVLSAPLTGQYFFDSGPAPAGWAGTGEWKAEAGEVAAEILVSVEKIASRTVPVTGTFTVPASGVVEARVKDTINISGTFNVKIPVALQNPTSTTAPFNRGYKESHKGIDFKANDGDPIYAAQEGTVVEVFTQKLPGSPDCNPRVQRGGGLTVRIKHADDSVSGYAHLLTGSVTVTPGQHVSAHQQIAQADHTGGTCPEGASGAHLHFGHRVNGQPVDPTNFFTTNQQEFEQKWLDKLSFVTSVNGTPVEATRRPVTGRDFTYNAPLDLSALANIESGHTYPLVVSVQTTDGASMQIYSGKLKVLSTALRAVLTWDRDDTDVDLHVIDSGGRESWYGQLCGIPGGCLDHDDTDGFGPETFSLSQFAPGLTYRVFLHYYSDHGNGPTTAVVKVYADDRLVTERGVPLSDNQVVTIGTYPSAQPEQNPLLSDTGNARVDDAPVFITLRPTDVPGVWEYSLPGLPRLHIVRKE